jgi:hypothetical protein
MKKVKGKFNVVPLLSKGRSQLLSLITNNYPIGFSGSSGISGGKQLVSSDPMHKNGWKAFCKRFKHQAVLQTSGKQLCRFSSVPTNGFKSLNCLKEFHLSTQISNFRWSVKNGRQIKHMLHMGLIKDYFQLTQHVEACLHKSCLLWPCNCQTAKLNLIASIKHMTINHSTHLRWIWANRNVPLFRGQVVSSHGKEAQSTNGFKLQVRTVSVEKQH